MDKLSENNTLLFDYYYGQESEQFVFYRIPKLLIKDEAFRSLSNDAKLLYGLLLDRMSLSQKNHWFDDKNRTFIIYSIEEIMSDLNCSRGKAVKSMAELDTKNGIGLVEKVRRGMGQPNILYVKNFIRKNASPELDDADLAPSPENDSSFSLPNHGSFIGLEPSTNHADQPVEPVDKSIKSNNKNSRSSKFDIQEVQNSNFMNSTYQTSNGFQSELQKVHRLDTNNNYINNTNYNNTEERYLPHRERGIGSLPDAANSVYRRKNDACQLDQIRRKEDQHFIFEKICKNIEWDHLSKYSGPEELSLFQTLLTIISDTIASTSSEIFIGNQSFSRELVIQRFLSLNSEHFRYIYESLQSCAVRISNTYGYLLSALFHAPVTMDQFYSQQVSWEEQRIEGRFGEHKVS